MTGPLSGPGVGLALSQNLYPSELNNAPLDAGTNRVALAPGEALPIPRGTFIVSLGKYLILQFRDPVTGIWTQGAAAAWNGGSIAVSSDGFNYRIANMLGCPLNAVVAALGSGYVQATTTITPTPGNSTWAPLVGGALALVGGTLTSNGAGYGVAPIVFIPPPPPASSNPNGVGGIQASGYCTIASGTVSGFTFTNPGAGYPTAPTPVILPNPTDPNIATGITQAVMAFSLTGSGEIRGALCTNPGAAITPNAMTLTIAGAGSNGSLTANILQTVTAASVSGAGTGYGTAGVLLTTVGGVPAVGSIATNPDGNGLAWLPRPAQVGLTVTGAGGTIAAQLGTIYDGGMFLTSTAPTFVLATQPLTATTVAIVGATIALTMGSRPDIAIIQPLAPN